jgi:hypothetical protein
MSKNLRSELEENAGVFLDDLQQKEGLPFYILSLHDAHAILSGLQVSISVKKLPADIENYTIPRDPSKGAC